MTNKVVSPIKINGNNISFKSNHLNQASFKYQKQSNPIISQNRSYQGPPVLNNSIVIQRVQANNNSNLT